MSILITGIDMPRHGMVINIYSDGRVANHFDEFLETIATAVPVPPHGDLVERKAVLNTFSTHMNRTMHYVTIRDTVPTIIPAEEGEVL